MNRPTIFFSSSARLAISSAPSCEEVAAAATSFDHELGPSFRCVGPPELFTGLMGTTGEVKVTFAGHEIAPGKPIFDGVRTFIDVFHEGGRLR